MTERDFLAANGTICPVPQTCHPMGVKHLITLPKSWVTRLGQCVTCVTLGALALPAQAAEPEVPVMIGRDGPELDACGAIGKVARLDPEGDNFLAVREGPNLEAAEKDRLEARTLVWLCDSADEWQGIVYPSGDYQDLGDCRVGSPVRVAEPYAGPCRHGWVAAHYIELVAG